jgi:multidrug efflux system membrane fusion protein
MQQAIDKMSRLGPAVLAASALALSGCQSSAPAGPGGEEKGGGKTRPIPVITGAAHKGDMPIYLSGLGAVTAFYTATVKSRVDGRIDEVLFKEGQEVKRGQALLQIDPRPFAISLQSAEAALARDEATLKNNRLNVERNTQLLAKDLVAKQIVTDLQATVDQFEGTVMADQAAVDNARLQLEWSRITAPIAGRTGVRLVDPGNLVHASDANGLVVITQLDPIAVLFTLPEDDLPEVALQMAKGPLSVEAYSRDGKLDLGRGKLMLIDNQINQSTGTMRLKAVFENPNNTLWPNQFVRVDLHVKTLQDALYVPAAALQHGPHGDYVYTVDKDDIAHVTQVELESLQGEKAVIKSGLSTDAQVVVDGQYKLHEGAHVQATRPNAAADTSAR